MKKILILYLNNGDMRNIYKKELMWNKVMEWVTEGKSENELRQVEVSLSQKDKHAKFADGTTVWMIPIGSPIHGIRATHIFVSDEIYNLPNGFQYVVERLMPAIVSNHSNYLDTEGKDARERLLVFKTNDNNTEVELEKFNFHFNK